MGDPINRSDPSGHLSVSQWISIGLGIAGILVSVLTLGLGAAVGPGLAKGVTNSVTKVTNKISDNVYNASKGMYGISKSSSNVVEQSIEDFDDIVTTSNYIGSGTYGTAYKYRNRVYKILHEDSTIYTDPERQKKYGMKFILLFMMVLLAIMLQLQFKK